MKSFRNIALAFGLLLLVSGQVAYAIAPGSGHNRDKGDKQMHHDEGQSLAGLEGTAAMEAVSEEDLIEKPASAQKNAGASQKSSPASKQTSPNNQSRTAPEAEAGSQDLQIQRNKEIAESHSGVISGAVGKLLMLITSLDRDELPVSDNAIVVFLLLLFLVPPFTVFASTREMKSEFWFNVLLTSFLWVPGLVHASIVLQRQS